MQKNRKRVFIVAGPTAVGKTAFAIKLALYLNTEIISADSRQFFCEMSIGTAVPNTEELNLVPHHFIQHLSIHEDYNVHKFERDALKKIEELFAKYGDIVVVGGSGLYLNALAFGIDELPDPSEETRAYLNNIYQTEGLEGLGKMLQQLDPDFYNSVDLQNPNRVKRALEVCITTGIPYSKLRLGVKKEREFSIKWVGLTQSRKILYDKINIRVDKMLSGGLLDEVKSLVPFQQLNALNTVGYREFFLWLNGLETYEWAVEKVKTNSRRYAKRQMTWFSKNADIQWIDIDKTLIDDNLFKELTKL